MKINVVEVISKFITQISSGTPSGTSIGQIWYDSALNKFRGQKSSGVVNLEEGVGGGGGVQNLFIQDTQPTVTTTSLWIDTTGGDEIFYIVTPD